jgi:hypothetical protein
MHQRKGCPPPPFNPKNSNPTNTQKTTTYLANFAAHPPLPPDNLPCNAAVTQPSSKQGSEHTSTCMPRTLHGASAACMASRPASQSLLPTCPWSGACMLPNNAKRLRTHVNTWSTRSLLRALVCKAKHTQRLRPHIMACTPTHLSLFVHSETVPEALTTVVSNAHRGRHPDGRQRGPPHNKELSHCMGASAACAAGARCAASGMWLFAAGSWSESCALEGSSGGADKECSQDRSKKEGNPGSYTQRHIHIASMCVFGAAEKGNPSVRMHVDINQASKEWIRMYFELYQLLYPWPHAERWTPLLTFGQEEEE